MKKTSAIVALAAASLFMSGCSPLYKNVEPAPKIGSDRNDLKSSPCACGPLIEQPNFKGAA